MALRYARELRLASESREKCATLLNRVEEVLQIISDAESTKKVSEYVGDAELSTEIEDKCQIILLP